MNILITGGTGYFAQGMVAHLLQAHDAQKAARPGLFVSPLRVGLYSRNEWNQHLMRQAFNDDDRLRWFIGDVRDRDRLTTAMAGMELVVHAAALKRVEVGETNPVEMVRTNIDGAINVITAARSARVQHVVALSSDKAVESQNCYGATKMVAEKLFLAANTTQGAHGPTFAVARYGNISGSTGSIIPIWRSLLERGEPIKVTHLDCTRFWMLREEAVRMVMWCAGKTGLHIPNLRAYRLGDLAQVMTEGGGQVIETGLGPGEKMHETMMSPWERHLFRSFYPPDSDTTRQEVMSSDHATRLSLDEIRDGLRQVHG